MMGCTQKATVDDVKLAAPEQATDTLRLLKETGTLPPPKGVQLPNTNNAWRRCYTVK